MSNLPPRITDLLPGEKYEDFSHKADLEDFAGEAIIVGDGEYLHVETLGNWRSATWSSTLTVHEFLKVLGKNDDLAAPADNSSSFISFTDPEEGQVGADGMPDDIVQFIEEEKPVVGYLRLDYDALSVCWGSSRPRIKGSDAEHAEIGIMVPVDNGTDQLKALIQQTATATVRDNQQILFSRMKQVR